MTDEFLAAEPARNVFVAEQIFEAIADHTQHHIAGIVAVIVIVFLEMIDIDWKDADALTGPRRAWKFAAAGHQHVPPVEQPGQHVPDRPVAQLIAQFDIRYRQADLLGANKPQPALLRVRFFARFFAVWPAVASEFEISAIRSSHRGQGSECSNICSASTNRHASTGNRSRFRQKI
jgi:hypothetical protein